MGMQVVGGDFKGFPIIFKKGQPFISTGAFGKKGVFLNEDTIEKYEVVGEDTSKSLGSSVVKGAVGGALLGPVGLVAGTLAGSNKTNATMVLYFKDGKKSIVKVNEAVYHYILAKFL